MSQPASYGHGAGRRTGDLLKDDTCLKRMWRSIRELPATARESNWWPAIITYSFRDFGEIRRPRSKISTRSTTRRSSAFASRNRVPIGGVVTRRSSLLMNIVFVCESSASSVCVSPRASLSSRR